MKRQLLAAIALCVLGTSSLHAASLAISLGIRETQAGGGPSGGPIFSNGGSAGGIEFVNLDGQTLVADGTWQQFTFNPVAGPLTAFAGGTANSMLDGEWGVLEHIRIRNIDGITQPIRMWIDNVTNTGPTGGPVVEGFESFAVGTEAMFQEPGFSGSTSANLRLPPAFPDAPNTTLVADTAAFAGSQSLQSDFHFLDNNPTRWVRLTTFGTPQVPNPAIYLRDTTSFWLRAVVIPEPSSFALLSLGVLGVMASRRRHS